MNDKVTIIIPARNEKYLEQTINNVLDNARGDIEIIVELDGWVPSPQIVTNDDRVIFIHNKESIGQRQSINHAAKVCSGKYVMKLDAHCAVDEGFDVKLKADCEYDWTVVPRMYNLDIETFLPKKHKRTDYMHVGMRENGDIRAEYYKGSEYRRQHKKKELIDDTMCIMGPCFFMHKERFWELGGCDEGHGSWGQQGIEVALKAQLSGGRMIVNKKTWFAHWFRGNIGFPYSISGNAVARARDYSKDLWLQNEWPLQKIKFEDLIKKYNPPTWENRLGIPKGRWYQEATINGVNMSPQRRNDTSEKRWSEFIAPLIEKGTGKVVDLGCNAGFYSRKMIDLGYSVTGIEQDDIYFNHAKYWEEQVPKGLNLIKGDILNADFTNVDVVLMANVHYWVEGADLKSLFDKMKDVKKIILIGRYKFLDVHKIKPDLKTLMTFFKDWKMEKTIKGKKHYSVSFIKDISI